MKFFLPYVGPMLRFCSTRKCVSALTVTHMSMSLMITRDKTYCPVDTVLGKCTIVYMTDLKCKICDDDNSC